MAREMTILERLREGRPAEGLTAIEDTNRLVRSIMANLSRILSAREEHAPAQPDFGLPAPSEITSDFPASINRLQKKIRLCIEKYEPRLTDVQILHVENPDEVLSLRFQIRARLATSETKSPINFDTRMDASGHMSVRR